MGRNKFKLRRKAWIEPDMMISEAFRTLPLTAMWVLLRFTQKVKWFDSRIAGQKQRVYEYNGLTFTYAEANHYGLSNATFYRAIRTLVGRGFIDVEHRGGTFGHGEIKDYSRFKMSNRWRKWGTDKFEKKSFEVLKYQGEQVQARIKSRFQK